MKTVKHIVVDGQQRIRAVLDFVHGTYKLEGTDVTRAWRGLSFEDLSPDEKKVIFGYKFVVRILPSLDEEGVRKIFARLNRNVVALNEQELRNATYWGKFIKCVQKMADEEPFWANSGLFSANDHRRMLHHEYISELAIAYLHAPQNKKDKLDHYYQLYEESFEDQEAVESAFRKTAYEVDQILPNFSKTRWKKKSDFYTLFLVLTATADDFPLPADLRAEISARLLDFGERVDGILRLEEDEWGAHDERVVKYARSVARAASDRGNRVSRANSLRSFVFRADEEKL